MEKKADWDSTVKMIKNSFLSKFPKKLRLFVVIVCSILLFLFSPSIKNLFSPNNGEKAVSNSTTQIGFVNIIENGRDGIGVTRTVSTCDSGGWVDFDKDHWDYISRFVKQGDNIFTLDGFDRKIDSVMRYKKSCKGDLVTELEFSPLVKELIDLNIYYDSWFRWEIGGRDRNSVRLYKNNSGCQAMKEAVPVELGRSPFLFDGSKLMVGSVVTVKMEIHLNQLGGLDTVLGLSYLNKEGDPMRDNFRHSFDINQSCSDNGVLDINDDYGQIGVGLMKSSEFSDPLPKVKLLRFRITQIES